MFFNSEKVSTATTYSTLGTIDSGTLAQTSRRWHIVLVVEIGWIKITKQFHFRLGRREQMQFEQQRETTKPQLPAQQYNKIQQLNTVYFFVTKTFNLYHNST